MLPVPLLIFGAHLQGVDNMHCCSVHMDVVLQRRHIVRVIFPAYRFRMQGSDTVCKLIHKIFRFVCISRPESLCQQVLQSFPARFVFPRVSDQPADKGGHDPRDKGTSLVQVRTADESMGNMNLFPLNQQAHKAAAQGGTVSAVHPAAVLFKDIILYFPCHGQHICKRFAVVSVKAVIIHTDQVILFLPFPQHLLEIDFPCAGCSGQEQHGLSLGVTHLRKLHFPFSSIPGHCFLHSVYIMAIRASMALLNSTVHPLSSRNFRYSCADH